MLEVPPIVTQTRETCWAAGFESWSRAIQRETGSSVDPPGAQQVIEWFEDGRNLMFDSGRATQHGMMLMAGLGLMQLRAYRARRTDIALLGLELEKGHLYLSYFSRPGRAAHVVVCYGVDTQAIYVMDPMPDAGLITLPPNYFLPWHAGWVVVGTSLLLDLHRSLQSSLGRVGP
jgi:hypothetical protein